MTVVNKAMTMETGLAMASDATQTAMVCMQAHAELHSRLAASWLEMLAGGTFKPPAANAAPSVAQWSLEAMRLMAETTLQNIERYQDCARRVAGGKP